MKKQYIPNKSLNPVLQARKLEKLQKELDLHGRNIDALSKVHDEHITILSNFARHDIKNSIQSMDSILSTNTSEELTDELLDSLRLNLKNIRETINNFTELVPHSSKSTFEIEQLITAVELLNRSSFHEENIKVIKELPDISFTFHLPFQSVVQMVNNVIINAMKALKTKTFGDKIIKLSVKLEGGMFFLNIFDNADKISRSNPDEIFEYGVSTTGGSGIGLYHAKYLCGLYKGEINLIQLEDNPDGFTKYFSIELPILKKQ
ncbi:MAG: sensor histidine kinase [Phocaeicola sp.]